MPHCPDCGKDLIEISFETETAGKIHCWYCSNCGGSFFEHWDSNLLTLSDIKNQLSRLFKQEAEVSNINPTPKCPLDGTYMARVESQAVPKDIRIFFCETCRGNWFPKDELVKFKEKQRGKIEEFKRLGIPIKSVFAVFLPLVIITIITVITFFTKDKIITLPSFQFGAKAGIYQKMLQIKKIDETSVEISFFTDEATKGIVSYQARGAVATKEELNFSRYHYVRIDNLLEPQAYLFQITSTTLDGKTYTTEWLSAK